MNPKTLFPLTLIVLAFAANAASAQVASTPSEASLKNLFKEPLNVPELGRQIIAGGEDLESPFTNAHLVEQMLYTSFFTAYYHAQYVQMQSPVLQKLPEANDPDGHPLWFDGWYGESKLRVMVTDLLHHDQIEELDRLLNDWNNPSERMADGRWKLAMWARALEGELGRDGNWDTIYKAIQSWKQKYPRSRAVAFMEAIYWHSYAWDARGTDYAHKITPDRWKLFEDRLEKSQAVLLESKPYASDNPLWGEFLLTTGNDLWPKNKVFAVLRDQVKKNRTFEPYYFNMIVYLLPKWGGSWLMIDSFVNNTVENTKDVEGSSMYARLYWKAAAYDGTYDDLFAEGHAKWPQMKRGFDDLVRLYPHSAYDLNMYAAAACIAGDKETFQDLRFKMGKVITPESWPANYSLDFCEHRFAKEKI